MQKAILAALAFSCAVLSAQAQTSRYDGLADLPFTGGYLSKDATATLKDELVFQRAVQSMIRRGGHAIS